MKDRGEGEDGSQMGGLDTRQMVVPSTSGKDKQENRFW